MSELIDKIELLKTIDEEINNAETKYEADIMFKIKDIVQKQYVFDLLKDLKPVKRGKWVEESMMYVCSNCKHEFLNDILSIAIWETGEPYFCPHCGADMREESKNDP